jgi:hypothetical protein
MIGTKSIAEGESRLVGLNWLLEHGASVVWAVHELTWPGSASVTVSLVAITKGTWLGKVELNGSKVVAISSHLLSGGGEMTEPFPLARNKELRSDGIKIQGDEFIIDASEMDRLLRADPSNAEVIRRYLTGWDIAQGLGSSPSAWIISFGVLNRSDAQRYQEPFQLVEERVKPYRDGLTGQIHERDFWKFWDRRERFFAAMAGKKRILACPSTAKYLLMTFVDEAWVPSHSVKLFAFSDDSSFTVMQSAIHEAWARQRSGKLEQRLAYNLSKAFATFPWPTQLPPSSAGSELISLRRRLCDERNICFTDLYNLFHDPEVIDPMVIRLRELHIRIDDACAKAYGWTDIELGHDFHKVQYLPPDDRTRFTISEAARGEILHRLFELNLRRHEEELTRKSSVRRRRS